MVFKNHIAWRFLNDPRMTMEICEETYPDDWKRIMDVANKKIAGNPVEMFDQVLNQNPKLAGLIHLVNPDGNKTYYITETVINQLGLLKVHREGDHYNWKVFEGLPKQKITMILPNNRALRISISSSVVELFWMTFDKLENPGKLIEGNMKWVMLYFNPETGYICEHFDHEDGKAIEEFLYKLMCFFYLGENDEEIIVPGKSYGSRKTGKVINEFTFPVTIVNSKWNITSIRTEGFGVSGHFRIQPCGEGRTKYKRIFIEPFNKNGYKRTAGKINANRL